MSINFPTGSAVGIWHWPNSPAARPATVVSRVTFWQPGLPQGGGARPCPTDHASYLSSYIPQDIPSWWGVSSMVIHGQSKLERFAAVRRTTTDAQCAVVAALQHVGSIASMLGWIHQSCAAAPFTARLAFRDYGSCGPYGGVDSSAVEAAQGALVRDFSRTSSSSSSSAILIDEKQLFAASKGARLPQRLELSDPSSQLSLDHVLTSAFSCPHRSLDRRCLRHRRPPFDGQRSWAR